MEDAQHHAVTSALTDAILSVCERCVAFRSQLTIRAEILLAADTDAPLQINVNNTLVYEAPGDTTPISDVTPLTDTTPPADITPLADVTPPADITPLTDTMPLADITPLTDTMPLAYTLLQIKKEISDVDKPTPETAPDPGTVSLRPQQTEVVLPSLLGLGPTVRPQHDSEDSRQLTEADQTPASPRRHNTRRRNYESRRKPHTRGRSNATDTRGITRSQREPGNTRPVDRKICPTASDLVLKSEHDYAQPTDSSVDVKTEVIKLEPSQYRCGQCDFTSRQSVRVRRHASVHRAVVCPYCREVLPGRAESQEHISTHHADRKPYCVQCDRPFKSIASLAGHHHNVHGGKSLECDRCDYVTGHYGNLQRHKRTAHSAAVDNGSLLCDFCEVEFENKEILKRHRRETHQHFQCESCPKQYKLASRLTHHIAVEHGAGAGTPDALLCPGCGYACLTAAVLEEHMGDDKLVCEECGEQMLCAKQLKHHMETQHSDKALRRQCKFCEKSFRSKSGYHAHMRISHSSELAPNKRPCHTCHICGKGFPVHDYLKRHILSHDQTFRPYRCPKCNKVYKYHRNFKSHKDGCLNPEGFLCDLCPKILKSKSCLQQHKRLLHSAVKPKRQLRSCRICGLKFAKIRSHENSCLMKRVEALQNQNHSEPGAESHLGHVTYELAEGDTVTMDTDTVVGRILFQDDMGLDISTLVTQVEERHTLGT